MTEKVVVDVLLGLGVALVLASAAGLLLMKDVYQRVHVVAPMSTVAPVLVVLAVTVRQGWQENTAESWLALGFVVLVSPFLSHATVRAARIRECGDWRDASNAARRARRP